MFEKISNNLLEAGWSLVIIEEKWICATHRTQQHGIFIGNFSDLPQEFTTWMLGYTNISRWDAIVFCTEGIDSSHLKQHRFSNIQLWYWDTQKGNLFPFPPTNDQLIPRWLRQLSSSNPAFLHDNTPAKEQFRPYLTYLMLGINLVVFLLETLAGGSTQESVLIEFGAKVNSLIQAGQFWRLLTSNFIHIGILHLAFNLYALWALGPLTEESFGHRRFFIIYILSGLGGSIASLLFTTALSAGASGAIFGLLGALLYYSYKRPHLWKSGFRVNLVIVILVNFGFGMVQPGIDNFAHLGGLLTGTITSILLTKK